MKCFISIFLFLSFLLSLPACGGVGESESVSESYRGTGIYLENVYSSMEEYESFLQRYVIPQDFISYEAFASVGQFDSLTFPLWEYIDLNSAPYSYCYDLSDANGMLFSIYVDVKLYNAEEGFGNDTKLEKAPKGETVSLHSEKYRDTWVVFEDMDNASYFYNEEGNMEEERAFLKNNIMLSFASRGQAFSDYEFLEEENPVSCLYRGDYEGFLAFFSYTE